MSATELQRDEEKAAALSIARKPLVVPPTGQDPALSVNHPFYDVARHGILQVAGGLQLGGPRIPDRCQRPVGPVRWGVGSSGCLPVASLSLALLTKGSVMLLPQREQTPVRTEKTSLPYGQRRGWGNVLHRCDQARGGRGRLVCFSRGQRVG